LRLRLLPVTAGLLAAAACSSSSSGGGTVGSPTSTATTADPAAVDQVLHKVLQGLTTATSISPTSDLGDDGTALQTAATELEDAANAVAHLVKVPLTLTGPLHVGLHRVSQLLERSGSCLTTQSAATKPDAGECLPPLRQAEAKDAALAHKLISLSVYGTLSPKKFERDLVAALRGG
jgi:hypothetical protein